MSASFLSRANLARVQSLLDAKSWSPFEGSFGVLLCGRGRVDGRELVLLSPDPSQASGAIGVAECNGFQHALGVARHEQLPLVLLLDSAGAKLTDGVKVLGAFRRIQRELMLTIEARVPCIAIVGKHCFGGASLLAFTASTRVYPQGSRVGLSGPRALAAISNASAMSFDDIYRSEQRQRMDAGSYFTLNDEESIRAALTHWLRQPIHDWFAERHRRLHERILHTPSLSGAATTRPAQDEVRRHPTLLGLKSIQVHDNGVADGEAHVKGSPIQVLGFVNGVPVDAQMCWQVADHVMQGTTHGDKRPLLILLDSPGQHASVEQEQLLLSEYVAHVARAVRAVGMSGRPTALFILGEAGGAVYVALAAAVGKVYALPETRLQTLPQKAVEGVLGTSPMDQPNTQALLDDGVIDALGVPY